MIQKNFRHIIILLVIIVGVLPLGVQLLFFLAKKFDIFQDIDPVLSAVLVIGFAMVAVIIFVIGLVIVFFQSAKKVVGSNQVQDSDEDKESRYAVSPVVSQKLIAATIATGILVFLYEYINMFFGRTVGWWEYVLIVGVIGVYTTIKIKRKQDK